jgi:hypothetical protein
MYIFGGILWIVPAGFAIAFFSMILFFYEKNEYPRLSQAFKETARHMIGNRLALFAYKLVFYLVYFLLFMVAGLFMILVYMLLSESMIISWLIEVCSIIIFVFMYSMITVYYHSCNLTFFEDVLSYEDRRQQKKQEDKKRREEKKQKEMEVKTEQIKQETKVEENKEVEEKVNKEDEIIKKEPAKKKSSATRNKPTTTNKSTTSNNKNLQLSKISKKPTTSKTKK